MPLHARYFLERSLDNDPLDAAILAFGTNDARLGVDPAEVVDAYAGLKATAEARGVKTLIALTPPIFPPEEDRDGLIEELNQLILSTFAPDSVVDFRSMVFPDDYRPGDGLHIGFLGYLKRAAAAYRLLTDGP